MSDTVSKSIRFISIKKDFFFILVLIIAILFTYGDLRSTFYQQDEWLGLGSVISQGWAHVWYEFSPLQIIFGEGRIATRILGMFFFNTTPPNITALAFYSIFFHIGNTILGYILVRQIVKKSIVAFLPALFFAVNSNSHQAITWFGTSFGTLPATSFIFLSLILYLLFLKKNDTKLLFFSFLSAFVSLHFKEIGIFLILFLPLLPFFMGKTPSLSYYFPSHLVFFIYSLLFIFFRLIEIIVSFKKDSLLISPLFVTSQNSNQFLTYLSHLFYYPLTSFSLIYVPAGYAREVARHFARAYYPFSTKTTLFDMFFQTMVLDLLSVTASFIMVFLLWVISKKKEYTYSIWFGVTLFIASLLPFIVIEKSYAYLESRYYYVGAIAAGVLFTTVLFFLYEIGKRLHKIISLVLLSLFLLAYFRLHIDLIKKEIVVQSLIASERVSFIEQLLKIKPTLSQTKNIFFIDGDREYIVANNNTPFQHGFGYSLMVLYYKSGKISGELLKEGYLWGIADQGYKEKEGKGFGYFWDFTAMRTVVSKKRIATDAITALYYDSKKKELRDITNDIQRKLSVSAY